MRYAVVGAGFSGSIVARALAEAGHAVVVFDERTHVAGNCHTDRDAETGVMVHRYGPHIFHTDNERAWTYVNAFARMMPFTNRVKAQVRGRVYSLPINLLTINQFFGKTLSPTQARAFLADLGDRSITAPQTFEEQALAFVGRDLYEAFFKGYTTKQWGVDPSQLPASILKRLPIRFTYDDSYFDHRYQGMPLDGYTAIVEKILAVHGIALRLGTAFEGVDTSFDHTFYTGAIDRFFGFRLGRLAYRTLEFAEERVDGDFQGTAVMNYCDADVPYTRITEHKYFAPWEQAGFTRSVIYREYSRQAKAGDTYYYPVRLAQDRGLLADYVRLARETKGVSFLGRLGTYRYIDMDVTVAEALTASDRILRSIGEGSSLPTFFTEPL